MVSFSLVLVRKFSILVLMYFLKKSIRIVCLLIFHTSDEFQWTVRETQHSRRSLSADCRTTHRTRRCTSILSSSETSRRPLSSQTGRLRRAGDMDLWVFQSIHFSAFYLRLFCGKLSNFCNPSPSKLSLHFQWNPIRFEFYCNFTNSVSS